jgi:hypothetical protein
MQDLRDLSRLPDELEYWNALEARITSQLGPDVRALADRRQDWWAPVARRAGILAGLAVAAGIAALLLAPRGGETGPLPGGILRGPDDPGMMAFVAAPNPPSIATLLLAPPGTGR